MGEKLLRRAAGRYMKDAFLLTKPCQDHRTVQEGNEMCIRDRLMAVDEEGKKYVDSSHFVLSVGTSQPDDRSISLTGTEPVKVEINLA